MRPYRSIAGLMVVVLVLAVGFDQPEQAVRPLIVVRVLPDVRPAHRVPRGVATRRGRRRVAWAGFAVPGWCYFALCFGTLDDPHHENLSAPATSRLWDQIYERPTPGGARIRPCSWCGTRSPAATSRRADAPAGGPGARISGDWAMPHDAGDRLPRRDPRLGVRVRRARPSGGMRIAGDHGMMTEPPPWLITLSGVSLAAAVASALVVAADIVAGRRQRMGIMNVVWPLTAVGGASRPFPTSRSGAWARPSGAMRGGAGGGAAGESASPLAEGRPGIDPLRRRLHPGRRAGRGLRRRGPGHLPGQPGVRDLARRFALAFLIGIVFQYSRLRRCGGWTCATG